MESRVEMQNLIDSEKSEIAGIDEDVQEIGILDVAWALVRRRKMIVNWTLTAALIALLVAFVIPNKYRSTTKILPPQQSQSASSMLMEQLGSIAGLTGGAPFKTPADLYVAMIQTDAIADTLVKRFDLQKVYGKRTPARARKKLQELTDINAGKEGMMTITVEDRDPKRAAALASGYVEELSNLSSRLALTEASRRRLFFEAQLSKAKEDLVKSELAMRDTQKSTGLVEPESQARATIESIVALQSKLVAAQVRLEALSTFATPQYPERMRLQQEVSALRTQIAALEGNSTSKKSAIIPTGDVPQAGLEYVRGLRDLKAQEAIFGVILKQYEMAKMDEARESVLVQVVQAAQVPDEKSSPPRTLIVVLASIAGFLVACACAFLLEQHHRVWTVTDAENARIAEMRAMLRTDQ
jgi:tyrosine-protein kinase Etk/Wzc